MTSMEALGCQSCGHVKKDKESNKLLALSSCAVTDNWSLLHTCPNFQIAMARKILFSKRSTFLDEKKMNADFVK